jgi:DNA adenine methylase
MIESPINYMGSKYKLLDKLIPLFPTNVDNFYDIFTGGGSVYLNMIGRYKSVYSNDILTDVIEIHKNLPNKSFITSAINYSTPTKDSQDEYMSLRNSYNINGGADKLLALIWSCNSNMMRFNSKLEFNQTWGKRCYNTGTEKKLNNIIGISFNNVHYSNKHFSYFKDVPENSFVYLDPPYSNTEAGYNAVWSKKDDDNLIELLTHYLDNNILFGISGVINDKVNPIYNFLTTRDEVIIHDFNLDLYKKVAKKDKSNSEYYISNYNGKKGLSVGDLLF